jgi:aerobic carbon-monoxide dehydrogenase large subunit
MVIAERYTGASVRRKEDPRILTGRGNYIADVTMPGMTHAAFLRSPFPHARIRSIDASEAREAPGVVAVFTGADMEPLVSSGPLGVLAMMGAGGPPVFTMLATDKVRLVGDPVALVIADTRPLAEDACELIEVDYEELPGVATTDQALDPDAPLIFEDLDSNIAAGPIANTYGDVEGAFAAADRIVRTRLHQHRHQNVPMETRGAVLSYDSATDELLVWIAGQGVALVQSTLAARTGIPSEKIRVRTGDVGGSFGLKIGAYREDVVCAAASKVLGRPVKWIEDRSENLSASGQARQESFDIEAAVSAEGQILGLKVNMTSDSGAYPGIGGMIGALIESMTPGPYKIGALAFERTAVITNKATYVAYRGPWAAETFLRERTIDLVARELGMEPLEVRRLKVATRDEPPLAMVTGRSLAGITVKESLDRLADLVDLPDFRRRQHEARSAGRYIGIGMASYIEGAPGPRDGDTPLGREEMRMRLDDDGSVLVFTAQMPHGQSHETTLAQIAADEFGVPFDSVKVIAGDTDVVPAGFTGGSRSATMAGGAALTPARALRSKVLDAAAHLLEASAEDLVISDSGVAVRGVPTSALSLADLAVAARTPGRLPADVDSELQVSLAYDGGQGGWAGGTHCAIVEIDVETGLVHVDRYIVVEDCGVLINPAVVDGQIRGGVAQGIGAVLLEKSAYDEDGQFLSSTFMDYLMPTAVDIPRIEISHLQTVPLDPDVNFRGVGEGGMIVAPVTVCNAIEDALAPFGVRITEQHLPPARILELTGAIATGE